MSGQSPKILVLYGSETGNAQDVAEEIGRLVERLRFEMVVLDLDSISIKNLIQPDVVVFVLSTTGQGEFPQNARAFWKALLSSALKPGMLRKLLFTSFGLGDSSYPQYNVAHRMLQSRLIQLGARSFCERGEGNEQHPEGHSAGLREWMTTFQAELKTNFLPSNGSEAIIEQDAPIEPKWKLESVDIIDVQPIAPKQSSHSSSLCPSTNLMPVKNAHTAYIQSNDRVTSNDHFQDVRLLDLKLNQQYEYGPGAVAIIYPKNFPEDIQQFIELMSWTEVADQPVRLVSQNYSTGLFCAPSPLKHLEVDNFTITLRWLLENVLDIMSIPRRSFFANLLSFAGTSNDDELYQRERLIELANPELIDELWDYTTRPKRTILEVMMDFTTINIPWQYAVTALPHMRGRQFSIASGGSLKGDDGGSTRVQLLVAIVDPPSPIIKWRRRYGVCTRYITTLQSGQHINIGMHQGYLDVKPEELKDPVVVIGPGTGIAPLRSLLHERIALSAVESSEIDLPALSRDVLIFGCRSANADYFFKEEWANMAGKEGLTVLEAFSRDKQHPRQYVQDQIRAEGAMIVDRLVKEHAKVYICGSSGNMPKGVRQALVDILIEHRDLSVEQTEEYLVTMERSGRYKQETW